MSIWLVPDVEPDGENDTLALPGREAQGLSSTLRWQGLLQVFLPMPLPAHLLCSHIARAASLIVVQVAPHVWLWSAHNQFILLFCGDEN